MNIFYTKTYNLSGENAKKQELIAEAARKLDFQELSFFRFPDQCDSDEELKMRMNAITAAVSNDAVVFMQYPSMVSSRYDEAFMHAIKLYKGVRLIIIVEDLGSEVCKGTYPEVDREIDFLNVADLLIITSEPMKEQLIQKGVKDSSILCRKIENDFYPMDEDIMDSGTMQLLQRNSLYIRKLLLDAIFESKIKK